MPDFQQLQRQFCAHLRDPAANAAPEGLNPQRLDLYQSLVYRNIESFLASGFPQVKARMREQKWHRKIRAFICSGYMTTPIFHELPGCFALWLSEQGLGKSQLDRMLEQLAHFAWVRHALDFAPDEQSGGLAPAGDLFAGRPCWSGLAWPLRYDWRVHDVTPEQKVVREPVQLLAWRDADDRIRWREVGPAVTLLAEMVREADRALSGQQLLHKLVAALPDVDESLLLEEGRNSLQWFKAQGMILGVAAA